MGRGTIVVGVDGSPESRAAVRWAIEEAQLRQAKLVVLHAWWAIAEFDPSARGEGRTPEDDGDPARYVDAFVDETVPQARSAVEIQAVAVQGMSASEALLEAARDADLLVLGSRGLGGFGGLMLGSVSAQCVHHAACPVAIVRS